MDWLGEHVALISALDGTVEFAIAVLVAFGVHARLGRIPPLAWLVIGYFVVEAMLSFSRTRIGSDLRTTLSLLVSLEVVGTLVLVLLLANVPRIVRGITAIVARAEHRAVEYERARRDYTQLVRHRIANPLTVIGGAARTLEQGELDDETRHSLRLAIIDAAETLQQIALDPVAHSPEELDLQPRPLLDELPPGWRI